jgi:AcrR family transcriptional regulator
MLMLVAERGYRAITVRDLAQAAAVSSRAFYQRYSSKEECFLCTHEAIARRIDRKILLAQEGEKDWQACLRVTIDTYLRELQNDLQTARLLLVDAYVAGQPALGHVRRAERTFELRLVECFELAATGMVLPPLVARGMAGGIICVARSYLIESPENDLTDLSESLTSWASAVLEAAWNFSPSEAARAAPHRSSAPARADQRSSWPAAGERSLIVTALANLAGAERHHELTARKVRVSAGASSRKFAAHFRDVDECFEEAVELCIATVVAGLAAHREKDADEAHDVEPVDPVGLLCEQVAIDSAFATLCFADIFAPGIGGVRCLDRVIEELEGVLVDDVADIDVSPVALEVSAAAIWAALREEVLCGRRARSARTASQLQMLISASPGEKMENVPPNNLTGHLEGGMLKA